MATTAPARNRTPGGAGDASSPMSNDVHTDPRPDAEAALQLMDRMLDELRQALPQAERLRREMRSALAEPTADATRIGALYPMLLRAYTEAAAVLLCLRESRTAIEETAAQTLHDTSAKLREVTSATETAAAGIMDGIDRLTSLVDQLDDAGIVGSEAAALRARLRDELFLLTGCLQFQDITTQQIDCAISLLGKMEHRLDQLSRPALPTGETAAAPPAEPASLRLSDPSASMLNAEERQALADEIMRDLLNRA